MRKSRTLPTLLALVALAGCGAPSNHHQRRLTVPQHRALPTVCRGELPVISPAKHPKRQQPCGRAALLPR